MGTTQTFTCDCCDAAMDDCSVLTCVMVTRLMTDGNVVQSYFCFANGCGGALGDFLDGMPAEHATHVPE